MDREGMNPDVSITVATLFQRLKNIRIFQDEPPDVKSVNGGAHAVLSHRLNVPSVAVLAIIT